MRTTACWASHRIVKRPTQRLCDRRRPTMVVSLMRIRSFVAPLLVLAGLHAGAAAAQCSDAQTSMDTAGRIARIACDEHALWYSPFIDEKGRLASLRVSEAEALRLRDGATPAWRRVAAYWMQSGVRWPPNGLTSGADCVGASSDPAASALCRAFLIDTPWSAVFVSWVMTRAGLPGFQPSARHVDYVRDAYRGGAGSPYRLADPDAEAPATGDLMCFARVPSQAFGAAGFRRWLDSAGDGALAMHCDVVVSTSNGRARLVGGNVLQGVTMRVLPLNRTGRFWGLPRRTGTEPECSPANPSACDFHRQDWVALLKLNPAANRPPASPGLRPPQSMTPTQVQPCCEVCALPMPEGMRRCPAPSAMPPAR